jgi:hypothetical protein
MEPTLHKLDPKGNTLFTLLALEDNAGNTNIDYMFLINISAGTARQLHQGAGNTYSIHIRYQRIQSLSATTGRCQPLQRHPPKLRLNKPNPLSFVSMKRSERGSETAAPTVLLPRCGFM